MDVLTFIAAITKALAWPGAIALVVVILRRQLRGLVRELRHLKFKDFEADFGRALERATSEAEKAGLPLLPPKPETLGLPLVPDDRFERLAVLSPRSAILEAWLDVETAIRELAERHNVAAYERRSVPEIAHELFTLGVLFRSDMKHLDAMRHLRNQAAHPAISGIDINLEQAREFRGLALRFIDELKRKSATAAPPPNAR